jgi:hypothetical protein
MTPSGARRSSWAVRNVKPGAKFVTYPIITLVAVSVIAASSTAVFAQEQAPQPPLGFFVTSATHSGNLGGLAGADAECQRLATAAGAGGRTWRAYLSTQGSQTVGAVNARDRIGEGPWHNANGVMIAASLADLHGDVQRDTNLINVNTAVDETGELVNGFGRPEGTPQQHDMLTGMSNQADDRTCNNWTSDNPDAHAMIGHHDRMSGWNTSWNSSHSTAGCSLESFNSTGGAGRFYCFAAD